MKNLLYSTLFVIVTTGMLSGCATSPPPYNPEAFTPVQIDTSQYRSKADSFVIILDASSSMNDDHDGHVKFHRAKDVISQMNQTIPDLDYQAGLVAFGNGACLNDGQAALLYGLSPYTQSGLADGLDNIECAVGISPLYSGVDISEEITSGQSGNMALIIVSDFKDIYSQGFLAESVEGVRAAHGAGLCVHTIKLGNARQGDDLIAELAGVNGCGSSVHADSLSSPAAMADYVAGTLLEPVPTPVVTYEKNVLSTSALFDHDSAALREEGKSALQTLGENIRARGASVVDIDVIGHTDSTGDEDYNMGLSVRRAEAVRDYLVSRGIDSSIIDVSGLGETSPISSNATREGRAQNRRVEIHVGISEPAT